MKKILIGHPAGNPNSYHAALSHFERGYLNGFIIPWLPTDTELKLISCIPGFQSQARRLQRRKFPLLRNAPVIQGRMKEWIRLLKRLLAEKQSYIYSRKISEDSNRWVMNMLVKKCKSVDIVHSYEDCSLLAFDEAKRLGKECVYDMPIGFYKVWQDLTEKLYKQFADWTPVNTNNEFLSGIYERKIRELELADLVLVPSQFVKSSIEKYYEKKIAVCRYGVDLDNFSQPLIKNNTGTLKFLYAGHLSIRKGTPLLIEAWKKANLNNAELRLAGSWYLSDAKKNELPDSVKYLGHLDWSSLQDEYRNADIFVFPSYFEGYGLVITEAMASGLPVITSSATIGPDILDDNCGRVFNSGDMEELIFLFEWFAENTEKIPEMGIAARHCVEKLDWSSYRNQVGMAIDTHF